jgi:hypothetical protein
MKLYHGTNTRILDTVRTHGILPRRNRKGNWSHTINSRKDAVYLTVSYAAYYAIASVPGGRKNPHKPMIVEIDTDLLDENKFAPDEDTLEQANRERNPDDLPAHWTMKQRTVWYRNRLHLYSRTEAWKASIELMGNCCYLGEISAPAAGRIAIIDPGKTPQLGMLAMDPSISLLNYHIMGRKYRALTKWIFNDPLGEDGPREIEWKGAFETISKERQESMRWDYMLPPETERAGIEIVTPT